MRKARKYASVWICSYSDFFLPEADKWRDDAWAQIRGTPNLIWQITSKRVDLIRDRLPADWGKGYPNVWLGTSVELKKYLPRMDTLRKIPCVLRWVDFAPTLEDLMPELRKHIKGFSWVCGGGEIGCGIVKPRKWDPQWTIKIKDLCLKKGISFFYRQGKKLDGVEYVAVPPLTQKGAKQ